MKATNEEWMKYLGLMQQLMESGYKCESEISRAITELNKSMFPQEEKKKVNVLIFEQDNFHRTVDYYSAMMDITSIHQVSTGSSGFLKYAQFNADEKRVVIVKLSDSPTKYDMDKFRGMRFDFILNHTSLTDAEITDIFSFVATNKYTR